MHKRWEAKTASTARYLDLNHKAHCSFHQKQQGGGLSKPAKDSTSQILNCLAFLGVVCPLCWAFGCGLQIAYQVTKLIGIIACFPIRKWKHQITPRECLSSTQLTKSLPKQDVWIESIFELKKCSRSLFRHEGKDAFEHETNVFQQLTANLTQEPWYNRVWWLWKHLA